MARKTKAQIGMLLADLYAAQSDKRKAEAREKDLKAEVEALGLAQGAYGGYLYSLGTPRTILDQPEAKKLLTENGIVVPMVSTKAPIVVKPVD